MYDFATAAKYYTTRPLHPTRNVAFDFETTGLNLRHGDAPFMGAATFCNGEVWLWQAEVNPFTRQSLWSAEDLKELAEFFTHDDWGYIGSNVKFDVRCAKKLLPSLDTNWLLCRSEETIGMHHALNNRESHTLKDAAAKHGGIPDTDESDLVTAVKQARHEASLLGWAVASKVTCPQVKKAPKKGWGVMDYWVPRQLALHYWRTSEAYEYISAIKPRPLGGDGGPTLIFFNKQDRLKVTRMQGWEWRPPELEIDVVTCHPWHTLCATYCKLDTLRSVTLYQVFRDELFKRNLWDQYMEHRLNTVMSYRIEDHGVDFNADKAKKVKAAFEADASYTKQCAGYTLSPIFPFNPNAHDRIRSVLYDPEPKGFHLPVSRLTKSKPKPGRTATPGRPTTDKDFLAHVIGSIAKSIPCLTPERSADLAPPTYIKEDSMLWRRNMKDWHKSMAQDEEFGRAKQLYMFCASLLQFSKSNKAISQIDSFLLAALNYDESTGFATLFPSINPYGTKTTRQSSSNPNGTNISKGGKSKESVAHLFKIKRTLRMLFGPRPGYEWWSVDYTQIQLVIFAFLCKDDRLIAAVLRGDDFHATMARIIFGHSTDPSDPRYDDFDPKHNSAHAEQRDLAKNVNFAFLFGAQETKIELTAGMPGLYDILCNRLPAVIGFLDRMEWEVIRNGYVFTAGGYRLYVDKDKAYSGSVYAIQGTEGEIVKRATYGVQHYFDRRDVSSQIHVSLPVHDELNFNTRLGYGQRHISPICSIMEDAAQSFGFPCKVTPKLCVDSWAKGEEWKFEEEEELV